ncbi:PqqD family protein [Myxococcota bacterium]|nr:PqqD family protein [Myxococcota bacterium]
MHELSTSPDVILTELEDGTGVLLHLKTKFYYVLNETGVFAWKALHAKTARSVDALASAVHEEFEVGLDEAKGDLEHLVSELVDEGLVTG